MDDAPSTDLAAQAKHAAKIRSCKKRKRGVKSMLTTMGARVVKKVKEEGPAKLPGTRKSRRKKKAKTEAKKTKTKGKGDAKPKPKPTPATDGEDEEEEEEEEDEDGDAEDGAGVWPTDLDVACDKDAIGLSLLKQQFKSAKKFNFHRKFDCAFAEFPPKKLQAAFDAGDFKILNTTAKCTPRLRVKPGESLNAFVCVAGCTLMQRVLQQCMGAQVQDVRNEFGPSLRVRFGSAAAAQAALSKGAVEFLGHPITPVGVWGHKAGRQQDVLKP
eukprot:NODE_630_length_1485_cov_24.129526_g469_i0.p1 GENE.NODE_630_length_1485_cov_24.129526_g469_i0~~NODE_630_length_1485_cov_24.129526_g469_i0.p1  ORF type:complete len:290 (-),score=116.78 NODE_630_length_1485_cov_24.129526_g469_i0:615-1427(-)